MGDYWGKFRVLLGRRRRIVVGDERLFLTLKLMVKRSCSVGKENRAVVRDEKLLPYRWERTK